MLKFIFLSAGFLVLSLALVPVYYAANKSGPQNNVQAVKESINLSLQDQSEIDGIANIEPAAGAVNSGDESLDAGDDFSSNDFSGAEYFQNKQNEAFGKIENHAVQDEN